MSGEDFVKVPRKKIVEMLKIIENIQEILRGKKD